MVVQKTIDKYVGVLCEARKKKGLTEQQARDNLQDINVYGTLMVLAGDADGMVSGATTTTANTIRPALQVHSLLHPFCVSSLLHSLTHSLIQSITRLLPPSPTDAPALSLTRLLACLLDSLLYLCPLLTHLVLSASQQAICVAACQHHCHNISPVQYICC